LDSSPFSKVRFRLPRQGSPGLLALAHAITDLNRKAILVRDRDALVGEWRRELATASNSEVAVIARRRHRLQA
jgi:hypothetical protein